MADACAYRPIFRVANSRCQQQTRVKREIVTDWRRLLISSLRSAVIAVVDLMPYDTMEQWRSTSDDGAIPPLNRLPLAPSVDRYI